MEKTWNDSSLNALDKRACPQKTSTHTNSVALTSKVQHLLPPVVSGGCSQPSCDRRGT